MSTRCPEPDAVLAYLQHELSATRRADLDEHFDGCEACRRWVAELASLAPVQTAPAVAASVLGRYRLEHELGTGAMGVVWDAWDPKLRRRVAVKVVACPDPEQADRLLREARALAAVRDPNVVPVYDAGRSDGSVYIVMQRATGITLRRWQSGATSKRPSPTEILDAYSQAASGLAAVHASGLCHRDFKPDNVLVETSDSGGIDVMVTDFGLATGTPGPQLELEATFEPTESHRTASGALVGTPAYMAPELLRGGEATPASDQFSFCIALYEALTGIRPFEATCWPARAAAIESGPTWTGIPRSLRRILARGLHPDPGRRHASMRQLGARLRGSSHHARVVGAFVAVAASALAAVMLLARPLEDSDRARRVEAPPLRFTDVLLDAERSERWRLVERIQTAGRHEAALAALDPALDAEDLSERARARFLRAVSLQRLQGVEPALAELGLAYGLAVQARDDVTAAWAAVQAGQIHLGPGADLEQAQVRLREAHSALQRASDPPPTLVASVTMTQAALAQQLGEVEQAAALYEEVLAIVVDGPDELAGIELDVLTGLGDLAPYLAEDIDRGWTDGIALYDRAVHRARARPGPPSPGLLIQAARAHVQPGGHEHIAFALLDEAEQALRQPPSPAQPVLASAVWMTRGMAYDNLDRLQEAIDAFGRCRDLLPEPLRDQHPAGLTCQTERGRMLMAAHRHAEARDVLSRNLDAVRRVMGPEHPMALQALVRLAQARSALGQHRLALEHVEEIRDLLPRDQSLGPDARAWIERRVEEIVTAATRPS